MHAARRDDRSIREDDLGTENVRGRRAPAHCMWTARVVRGHPAERARASAPRVGWEEEALRPERVLKVGEHDARLDDRLQVAAIDLDDLAHPRERDGDPAA